MLGSAASFESKLTELQKAQTDLKRKQREMAAEQKLMAIDAELEALKLKSAERKLEISGDGADSRSLQIEVEAAQLGVRRAQIQLEILQDRRRAVDEQIAANLVEQRKTLQKALTAYPTHQKATDWRRMLESQTTEEPSQDLPAGRSRR